VARSLGTYMKNRSAVRVEEVPAAMFSEDKA